MLVLCRVGRFSAKSSRFFCCSFVSFSGFLLTAYFEFFITCDKDSFFSSLLGGQPFLGLLHIFAACGDIFFTIC